MEERGRSHSVTAVRGGDGGYVVKVGDRARQPHRNLGAEVAALRLGQDPALGELVPRLLGADAETGTIVTELVEGAPAVGALLGPAGPSPEVAAALAAAVGGWHAGAARYVDRFPVAVVPWPLQFGTSPAFAVANHDGAGRSVLAELAGDPLLRPMLAALAREWTVATVVHGDCKADNALLVEPANGCGRARVVLVDWEFAGAGDPAWDLGCILAELLVAGLVCGGSSAPAMAAAATAYARTAGAVGGESLPRRTALAIVARVAALAFENAEAAGHDDPWAGELLTHARSVAGWLATWTRRIESWLV